MLIVLLHFRDTCKPLIQVLPTMEGVCDDLSDICNDLSKFASKCLDKDVSFLYDDDTCAKVKL